jgi:protoheme IX farnesyltransferase
MKTVVLCPEAAAEAVSLVEPVAASRGSRVADYVELTKPRVAVLVLFTVAAGALLAGGRAVQPLLVIHTVLATALIAAGASALNQFLERHSDGRMRRTEGRPLPSGRLRPAEVLCFGLVLGVAGVVWLALALPTPCAAVVAVVTFVCYVGVYTPLKSRTTYNTLVGAVPGALPPVIGYTAVTGTITPEAWALFLIVFVWQVPHFLAIAWIYRDEYARAGLRMLPVVDPDGRRTSRSMIAWCVALLPVSLLPLWLDPTRLAYASGAVLLGVAFLGGAVWFRRERTAARARVVLRLSLLYLPGLLALLLLDGAWAWLLH